MLIVGMNKLSMGRGESAGTNKNETNKRGGGKKLPILNECT